MPVPVFQKIKHSFKLCPSRMKHAQRRPSIFSNLTLIFGLIIIWAAFAPSKLGGQTSYVMVNGISMEPRYHTGDLVIIRKAQTYKIGDVVTYRDAEMGAYVIHRVIGTDQGQFVIKGDNNSWIDAYQPTQDEIIGKQWIYVPGAGRVTQWFRKPINLSLAVFLLGGVFMTRVIAKPPKNQKGTNRPPINFGGMLEPASYLMGFLFIGFLGLSIFSFSRPATRTADTIPYQQDGEYTYSATGTPGVYDTEMVRTGEPVFPKLTCFLNIGLAYNISGNQLQNVSGNSQIFARIMDEPSGWQRTIPLLSQTAFTGSSNFNMATLDLCELEALVNLVEQETGLRTNTYTVEIVTNIVFTATSAGQAIAGTFDPTLAFKYDKVHFYPANTNAEINSMHITKEGLAGSADMQANTLSFLGWEATVNFIRMSSLIGLGISLSGLILIGLFIFKTARQSTDALIHLRHGSLMVDIYEKDLQPTATTIDVTSMNDLAKIAEQQGSMILHMTRNFLHYYLVQNNGITYRYVISTGKKGITETDEQPEPIAAATENKQPAEKSARAQTPKHRMTIQKKNNGKPKSAQSKTPQPVIVEQEWQIAEETPEYIIHTGAIGFVMPETEILKKIGR